MRFRKELVGATTNILILSALEREPAHGYRVVQSVNEKSDGLFEWQEGTVYPALHRLEKNGLISGSWQKQSNGRRRKIYSLTAKGRKELSRQAREWESYSQTVAKVLGGSHA